MIEDVLKRYPLHETAVSYVPIGAGGGMSGARLWRITAAAEQYALKRWPREHPGVDHMRWVHRWLRHLAQHGCDYVPVPLPDKSGQTLAHVDGHWWELTRWLPGKADYLQAPSAQKLGAAINAIAQIHSTLANRSVSLCGPSRGLLQRHQELATISPSLLDHYGRAIDDSRGTAAAQLARAVLEGIPAHLPAARFAVEQARCVSVPLHACLRDIWHDHVLFVDAQVSGILDFGAMRVDSPAGDLARLLGTMVGDDAAAWEYAIQTYSARHALTEKDRHLVEAFDRANVVLSGLNWVRWLWLEQRSFLEMPPVLRRLTEIRQRLEVDPSARWHASISTW